MRRNTKQIPVWDSLRDIPSCPTGARVGGSNNYGGGDGVD